MKINFVQTIIAVGISILIAYGFYHFHSGGIQITLSIGSFLFLSVTLAFSIGIKLNNPRKTSNIRVLSGTFFLFSLISNLIFNSSSFSRPSYIITNGILILTYGLIIYSLNKTKQ